MASIYLTKQNKLELDPNADIMEYDSFTKVEKDKELSIDKTEFTQNFIMEKLTPLILQSLNNMIDEKFNLLSEHIESRVEDIHKEISDLKPTISEEPEVVYIREITKDTAKEEITEYFKTNDGDVYPSEISIDLGIPYELVWEVFKELEEEGEIEAGD